MQASQLLLLFAGLVLATKVASFPIVKTGVEMNEVDLPFSKRGGKAAEGGTPANRQQHAPLSSFQKASKHVIHATAHHGVAVVHLVTKSGQAMKIQRQNMEKSAKGWGVDVWEPQQTLSEGFGGYVRHSALGLKHSGLAAKNLVKAVLFNDFKAKEAGLQAPAGKGMKSEINAQNRVKHRKPKEAIYKPLNEVQQDYPGQNPYRYFKME
jgi:hypothetical protein